MCASKPNFDPRISGRENYNYLSEQTTVTRHTHAHTRTRTRTRTHTHIVMNKCSGLLKTYCLAQVSEKHTVNLSWHNTLLQGAISLLTHSPTRKQKAQQTHTHAHTTPHLLFHRVPNLSLGQIAALLAGTIFLSVYHPSFTFV